jgi:hypothetical protein
MTIGVVTTGIAKTIFGVINGFVIENQNRRQSKTSTTSQSKIPSGVFYTLLRSTLSQVILQTLISECEDRSGSCENKTFQVYGLIVSVLAGTTIFCITSIFSAYVTNQIFPTKGQLDVRDVCILETLLLPEEFLWSS